MGISRKEPLPTFDLYGCGTWLLDLVGSNQFMSCPRAMPFSSRLFIALFPSYLKHYISIIHVIIFLCCCFKLIQKQVHLVYLFRINNYCLKF